MYPPCEHLNLTSQHFLYQAPFLSFSLPLQTVMAVFWETLWKGQLVLVALIISRAISSPGQCGSPVNLAESHCFQQWCICSLSSRRRGDTEELKETEVTPTASATPWIFAPSASHAEPACATRATAASQEGSQGPRGCHCKGTGCELNVETARQAGPAAISLHLRTSGSSLYNSQGKLRGKQLPANLVSSCVTVRQLAFLRRAAWNPTKNKAVVTGFGVLA